MAREQTDIPVQRRDGADSRLEAEPSIGELLRQLSADTTELVRQEVALAKAEMRQMGVTLAHDAAKVGIALGLALAGVLALTAFLVAGLGRLLDGQYWLSALIIGVLFLVVGGLLARSALADIKHRGLMPDQTAASLREDAKWAKREAQDVKRELTK